MQEILEGIIHLASDGVLGGFKESLRAVLQAKPHLLATPPSWNQYGERVRKLGGIEHEIFFDEGSQRVWKVGGDNLLNLVVSGGVLSLGGCSILSEYFDRLFLSDYFFPLGVRIEGIREDGGIVSSQKLVVGGEPTIEQIELALFRRGFFRMPEEKVRLAGEAAYYHPERVVVVGEAKPDNFKITAEGAVVAIDVVFAKGRKYRSLIKAAEDKNRAE
ncbi:MAG: hypothetical protein AAGC74_03895 [Verrucomicrobiota bacterium]